MFKRLFGLSYRQTQGFVDSLFQLMGLHNKAPYHTMFSKNLGKNLKG